MIRLMMLPACNIMTVKMLQNGIMEYDHETHFGGR